MRVLFFLLVSLGMVSSLDHPYKFLSMVDVCTGDKAVIPLGHKALILSLNVTRLQGDFTCHLELEVSKGFGFHVYIEEMNFEGSEDSGGPGCKEDFLQFARDILFFTTHSSPKYCGVRPKLNYTKYPFVSPPLRRNNDLARMYVEKKDSEMDVWVKLSTEYTSGPRNLTLVITPFKKRCRRTDLYYRMCSHSTHCVHKDYFCDEYVNCAWPGGDIATDEVFCRRGTYIGGAKDPYSSIAGDASDYYNIPLIIVVVIVVLVFTILLAYALQVFFRRMRKSDEIRSEPSPQNRRRLSESSELFEGSPSPSREPLRAMPSAPPSYEDVVSNQELIHNDRARDYDPPPMYTYT